VPRRRCVRGARPEARRDEEQEFPHSGNLHWPANSLGMDN
jgi:hypothetical protein